MSLAVSDLHCDLLAYLAAKRRHSAHDPQVRCSLPQLRQGGVKHQVLAVFGLTDGQSTYYGERQMACYRQLQEQHTDGDPIFLWAVENASCFCGEDESLDTGLDRLRGWCDTHGLPAYVSLTWNGANRFGGGCPDERGLTDDGKEVVELLHELGIACDLSHTSDALAEDILNTDCKVIASHSNFRAICDVNRNLPDQFAQEIIRRNGLIGLNLVTAFVGDRIQMIQQHAQHALELGGEDALALGADFFYVESVPPQHRRNIDSYFFEGFDDASCYPRLLTLLGEIMEAEQLEKVAKRNFATFAKP